MTLNKNAEKIFKLKYARGDETWEQACIRVASYIANAEESEELKLEYTKKFYELIYNKVFIPGGRILANSGTEINNLSNCFVLPIDDSRKSIYDTLKNAAEVFDQGGGCGYNFSNIREKGSPLRISGEQAAGPISFMSLFDQTGEVIQQASRRGAQLGCLDIGHPDIEEFINFKSTLNNRNQRISNEYSRNLKLNGLRGDNAKYFKILEKTLQDDQLSHFNISVMLNDMFMKVVLEDEDWYLISINSTGSYPVKAKNLFSLIAKQAWESGDPGVLFYDRINEDNLVPYLGDLVSVNPCLGGNNYFYTHSCTLQKIKDLDGVITGGYVPESPLPPNVHIFKTGTKPLYRITLSNGLFIELTNDHQITTLTGDKSVKDLVIRKDKIEFQIGDKDFNASMVHPTNMDKEKLAYELAGFLFGDGSLSADGRVYINLGKKDLFLLERYKQVFERWGINPKQHGNKVHAHYLGYGGKKFCECYGLEFKPIIERKLPYYFYTPCQGFSSINISAFLRGLWAANGSVLKNHNRIQLKSSNKDFIQDLQQFLALAIGIRSYISTNKENITKFSNGEYTCKKSYNLIIYSIDNLKFKKSIGFILEKHIENAKYLTSSKKIKHPYIKSIEYLGEEDVYDFVEESTHHGIVNGMRVHNCGEVPLLPYESCCLGSINLHAFYDENAPNVRINFPFLEHTVRTAVRFLDNVQTVSESPIKEIDELSKGLRRLGLGVMGWADLLAEMGIPYDSIDAQNLGKYLSWFISFFGWLESISLAKEKGTFPLYERDKVNLHLLDKTLNSPFNTGNKVNINEIKLNGLRNVAITSIAPTGTISILAGVNSGIEPFYALAYKRNITQGVGNTAKDSIIEVNPILERKLLESKISKGEITKIKKFVLKHGGLGEYPSENLDTMKSWFIGAHEISPYAHVDMQASWQKYVDSAISKTINLSENSTVEDIEKIILYMWNNNLKGGTLYRDQSKSFQILNTGK